VFDEVVGEAEHPGGLLDGGEAIDAVDREATDVDDVGPGERLLRAGPGRKPVPRLSCLEFGADTFGVQQRELADLAGLSELAEIRVAVDREVRHRRRDEVGLGGAGSGLVEQVDEPAAGDAFAARAGFAVGVDRQARGGVGEHPDGGPHVADRERGGGRDVRDAGVEAGQPRQLVFRPGERPLLAGAVSYAPIMCLSPPRKDRSPNLGPPC
jgi:hypothetical protein